MQIGVESSKAVDNKRLFVVDTDEITRMALQFMLHDENETHDLPSLTAAMDKSKEWKPDLLLLGVGVVAESGIDVLNTIKSEIDGVKILLVADAAEDPLTKACMDGGADGLLLKPLTVEAARKKVDIMLGRKRTGIIPIHAI
jgi:DNA-binding response OmpR family regulator